MSRDRSLSNSEKRLLAADHETLFDHLVPDPSHPRATRRTLTTFVLSIFLVGFFWFSVVETGTDLDGYEPGEGWVRWESVSWGGMKGAGGPTTWDLAADQEPKIDNEEEEDMETRPTGSTSAATSLPTAVSAFKSGSVTQMLHEGELSSYVWHAKLDGWFDTHAGDRRLIVVGDIHGMHESLTALLEKVGYTPDDTLIHVGDIVAKSSLNASLTTVSKLRSMSVKGVRGNHDQGVIEWRKWMEAYGPLSLSSKPLGKAEEVAHSRPSNSGANDFKSKPRPGYKGFQPVGTVPAGDDDKKKRRWFGWGESDDAKETENDTHAEAVEELERGSSNAPSTDDGSAGKEIAEENLEEAGEKRTEAEATEDEVLGKFQDEDALENPSDDAAEDADEEAIEEAKKEAAEETAGEVAEEVATQDEDEIEEAIAEEEIAPATTTTSPVLGEEEPTETQSSKDAAHGVAHSPLSSSGALLGPSWDWLELPESDLESFGVVLPKGWEWGGDWFEIARHLPQQDFNYLEKLPLTLHVEDLHTYVVHAGLLPWTESLATSSHDKAPGPLPALLTSTVSSNFTPSRASERLLTTPERSLLLVEDNTLPFTLLHMRALRKSKQDASGWRVTQRKKGTPWPEVWDDTMTSDCGKRKDSCATSVIYGHWAGRGLQVSNYTVGLDSGCVYGRHLSALVIPRSTSRRRTRRLDAINRAGDRIRTRAREIQARQLADVAEGGQGQEGYSRPRPGRPGRPVRPGRPHEASVPAKEEAIVEAEPPADKDASSTTSKPVTIEQAEDAADEESPVEEEEEDDDRKAMVVSFAGRAATVVRVSCEAGSAGKA